MEHNDTLIRLLEECREDDQPAFTLAYVSGNLHVTPRYDAAAHPAIVSRDASGYTVRYGTRSSACATPELAAAAIQHIFATARPARR